MKDGLKRQIQVQAEREGKTFTQAMEEAGSIWLSARRAGKLNKRRVVLPTFRGDGLLPGVDINDTSSLLDRLDDGVPLEQRR